MMRVMSWKIFDEKSGMFMKKIFENFFEKILRWRARARRSKRIHPMSSLCLRSHRLVFIFKRRFTDTRKARTPDWEGSEFWSVDPLLWSTGYNETDKNSFKNSRKPSVWSITTVMVLLMLLIWREHMLHLVSWMSKTKWSTLWSKKPQLPLPSPFS